MTRFEEKYPGAKSAIGSAVMKKYLDGKELTRGQAIQAFCYDCLGGYSGGVKDCETKECPLYRFHPYRNKD